MGKGLTDEGNRNNIRNNGVQCYGDRCVSRAYRNDRAHRRGSVLPHAILADYDHPVGLRHLEGNAMILDVIKETIDCITVAILTTVGGLFGGNYDC